MTAGQRFAKRGLDVGMALIGLVLAGWIVAIGFVLVAVDTGSSGFFRHERVGRHGRIFNLIKLRTMTDDPAISTTVTAKDDPRITALGRFLRRMRIDELPQLWNILIGDMSFVGPRPDVSGFADQLGGDDRIILSVRPGLTGPATLKYREEEEILQEQSDPERYNREVLFPDKVRLNREYIDNYRFRTDLVLIWRTVFGR